VALEAFGVAVAAWRIIQRFKVLLHHRVHVPLVGLQAEHIVGAMCVQLRCNALLTADGVDGDDAALQMQQAQQLRDGRDFVALAIDLALSEQQPHVGRPRTDQMQRALRITLGAAAHALAIYRHCALHLACNLGQPLLAHLLQALGIKHAKHPGKGVVRGYATRQGHQASKPFVVLLAKLSHLHPVVRACDGGAQGYNQNGLQIVPAPSVNAGIADKLQMLKQAHGWGCKVSKAPV
jgi:hypothetical protein